MNIAISSQEKEKNGLLDLRFGRCKYFLIFNTESKKIKAIKNKAIDADVGSGVEAANLVLKENIKAVITGNVGPNAMRVLKASNIKVFTSDIKRVLDVIDDYQKNKLKEFID